MRLQVEVVCPACPPYPAGTFDEPLPELYARWVYSVWRVEQAAHQAGGCDETVRLRITNPAHVEVPHGGLEPL